MSDGQIQPNNSRERSPQIDLLMKRYVEDRANLEGEELDELIAALRAQPALAVEIHSQLLLDDLLAQKLAVDRRNFLAQVGQRIGDFELGEDEIYSQVSVAVAEADFVGPIKRKSSGWLIAALGITAACLALTAVLVQPYLPLFTRQVAKVQNVTGDVVVGAERQALQSGDQISMGSLLEVPAGSTLVIEYRDKTTAQFGSTTEVTKFELIDDRRSRAKQIRLQEGEVLAKVTPQRDLGPMVFQTPQARAIVLGTQFRLIVSPATTRLDVTEGKVNFVRAAGDQQANVVANESAVADAEGLVLRDLQWPDVPAKLLFTLWGVDNTPLVRNPETNHEKEFDFEVREPAQFVAGVNVYNLNGGSLYSWEAGDDLVETIRHRKSFTVEAIVMPDSFRANDARIFGLGDQSNQANFRLLQRKNEYIFELWTSPNEPPLELNLGKVKADHATHLAVSYDGTTLTGYVQGAEKSRISGLKPGLAWVPGALSIGADANGRRAWRGTICDFAISDHALTSFEVSHSHGQYQSLFARRDTGLSWDNLMSEDLDPARYAGKGNWQIVDDTSWQNENVEDSWLGLGPDGLKSYDLIVDVHWLEGDAPLKLTLPVENRCSVAVLPKRGAEQKTTLQDMGGGPMPGNVTVTSEAALPSNRTARLEVQVRQEKDQAMLAVSVDGEPWLSWQGSPSELRDVAADSVPTLKKPTLITTGNVVRIDALKIRDLSRSTASAIGQ